MVEQKAEKDEPYAHRVNVNVGGIGKHPVVTLWCMDCVVVVQEFDQINEWTDLQAAVAEHCSQPSRREVLSRRTPGED
jgi:hypothetical protein